MKDCSYTDLFYHCTLDVEERTSLCILHSPDAEKDKAKFLEVLRGKVQRDSKDGGVPAIRLHGVVFPGPLVWSKVVSGLPTIAKPINFRGAAFSGDANFWRATFGGDVNFSEATFSGDADFVGATFSGDADFVGATFSGDAGFSGATFSGNADFSWATFTGDADFVGATFSGDTQLRETAFRGNTDFSWATFTQDAFFHRATFKGRTLFQHTKFPTDNESSVRLEDATVESPEEFFFEDVNFSRVLFLRTNLTRVQFTDVTWAKKPERFLPWIKHSVLFDQLELEKEESRLRNGSGGVLTIAEGVNEPPTARLVANLYRQLRLNYEGSKQEVEAGHFYIGQMDMRRRDPDTGWFTRRLALPVYRAVAMYGESAWRPLVLYLFTSFLFAVLYLYAGFYWGGEEPREAVDYAWLWGGSFLPFGGDFLKAWYLSLTAGNLRGNAQVMADWGLIVAYANMVWDIFLIALFVIALRRHFRR